MKILLVEDEKELSSAVKKVLQLNNYDVSCAYDGVEALDMLEYHSYDVVVLDVMMPKLDGITVVKTLRQNKNNTPVILLTAKSEIEDKVNGLEAGADDYLCKPFSVKELIARVKALTRRSGEFIDVYKIGDITLIPETFELKAKGSIRLTNKEFKLMEYLIKSRNVVLSSERIFTYVWDDSENDINVVWVFISSLRKKLKAIGSNVKIKVNKGVGYQLEVN